MGEVKIWESEVIEGRVYQGSSGKVYPYPTIETISDVKTDKTYRAVWLENEYLRVMILPQLGGPWISGGIEFNWPQHHRPTTFSPVDYMLTENPDSSKTCRVSDVDQMYGTKGEACFTLYPGKAYIEIRGQLYNRTAQPQTFLWWANPAVPVNENTQSIFPPDVHAVMDHGKRDVSRFPIAAGEYYKHDYSAGVDISRYKNIPVPTSYMAEKSPFDFVGSYDYGRQAGILHAADHHIAPGKKQWTWGCGDFGKAWDRNLTDEDGPYDEGAALSPVRTYQKTVEFTPEDETMLTVRVLDGNRGLKAYLLRKLGRGGTDRALDCRKSGHRPLRLCLPAGAGPAGRGLPGGHGPGGALSPGLLLPQQAGGSGGAGVGQGQQSQTRQRLLLSGVPVL